ncbi:MAG: hypothetical protein JXA21_13915 [Anaerolineae bacterium]|nr:hypothetical protein [Anaerolineae bacterium]
MGREHFIKQIESDFEYLVNEYGFSVVETRYSPEYFDNMLVRFQSPEVDIVIVVDKGQVLINVVPYNALPKQSFDLRSVVEFLTPSINEPVYIFPSGRISDDSINQQIVRTSRILRQYCSSILRGDFSDWDGLQRIRDKMALEAYRSITGKNPLQITTPENVERIQEEVKRRQKRQE